MLQLETLKLNQETEHKGVFMMTLEREEAMNSLNTQMALDIIEAFNYLKYQNEIRVLILTGKGQKSFCAGADLKERKGMTDEKWKKQHDIFEEAFYLLREFEYPTIAAINGYALGGGLELALSCDFRTISAEASVGVPEVKIGIIPGAGGTQLLSRVTNIGFAKEMLYTGKRINANKAFEKGIVNHVFEAVSLKDETIKIAEEIGNNAPLSLKAIKRSVNRGTEVDLNTGLSIELAQYYSCAKSNDREEGINAFNQKRVPNWSNS